MSGKDWTAEARRLLNDAVRGNGGASRAGAAGIHFHAPVTIHFGSSGSEGPQQRPTLEARLQGLLDGEGAPVVAAFRDELARTYGKDQVEALTNLELADLLANFNKLLRMARILAITPPRR